MPLAHHLAVRLLTIGIVFGALRAAALAESVPTTESRLNAQLPPPAEALLSWLPADTETVIAAQEPFVIKPPSAPETPFALPEALRALPMSLVLQVDDGFLHDRLSGLRVLVAVEGSRRFRSPRQLGLMPFDGCQIVRFAEGTEDRLRQVFGELLKRSQSRERIRGHEVAVFEEQWEQDTWTLRIAHPRPDVYLGATDKAYLDGVLARLSGRPGASALPKTLPEWEHVDEHAPFWAIRHYRKETAPEDPSSPLRGEAAANVPDPKAVGFVFWYEAEAATARARYISRSHAALNLVREGWTGLENLTPAIHPVEAGVVEISLPVRDDGLDDEEPHLFAFVLLAYLGHGVYL